MPETPGGSSAEPTRIPHVVRHHGRAVVGHDHDLQAVGELELADAVGRDWL